MQPRDSGLVDKVMTFIAPKIIGGKRCKKLLLRA